jgi:5-methylthioadenosine/S-adenosylhomocysteine deaminase
MKKPPADLKITNGLLLTMNGADEQYADGALAIRNGRIESVGTAQAMEKVAARKTIDAKGGIIMPGLINTHTHAAMTLFRGLADDLPLMTWLNDYIFPAEATLNPEKVYQGTLLACAEMIQSGTTCFCDMYLFEDAVAEAAGDAGMRAVVGEVLFDFPSPNYGPSDQGLAYTRRLLEKWRDHTLVSVAVEPHSPYLCAPELVTASSQLAAEYAVPLVIHLSETASEMATIQERYGKTPVGHLADLGVLGANVIACHCVVLEEADIELLARFDVKVAHNPESNMKLASGIAPVPDLLKAGICVGLGTDGCASNNNLDLFLEMDTAAKLHKVNTLDPTVADALSVLKMSTCDAARALGLADEIGSIEPGKRADVIVLDTRQPHMMPLYNPVSQIVYAAKGADVHTVIIQGRVVKEGDTMTTIDLDHLYGKIAEIVSGLHHDT